MASSSIRLERYTGSVPRCATGLPEQYQSKSWPPSPQPRRSNSPIIVTLISVSSGLLMVSKERRIGSSQQTSGLVCEKCTPSRMAKWWSAHPSPPANPRRFRKIQPSSTLFVFNSPCSSYSLISSFPFLVCPSSKNCHVSGVRCSTHFATRLRSAFSE